MSTNTTYNIRIDKRIRKQADALYKSMGLSLSSAINLFLTQSVIQGKLPISKVIAEPTYADTLLEVKRGLHSLETEPLHDHEDVMREVHELLDTKMMNNAPKVV